MRSKFAKAIAGNSDLVTAQAFVYPSLNLNLGFIITASGEDVFNKVRTASSIIENRFFEMEEAVPKRIEELHKAVQQELSGVENLQVLFAVWLENVLYVFSQGHFAYLVRDDGLINLNSTQEQSSIISGYLKPGDKLLLLNSNLGSYLHTEEDGLKEKLINLSQIEPDSFEEEVSSLWHDEVSSLEDSSSIAAKDPFAAILVDFHSDQVQIEKNSPEPDFKEHLLSETKFKLNRKWLMVIIALLIFVFSAIFLITKNQKLPKQGSDFDIKLASINEKLTQAQALADLDPKTAKQNLDEAKQSLEEASRLKPNDSLVLDIQRKIDEASSQILKIHTVSDWPVFLSLGLIKEGFAALRMSESLNQILLLDEDKKTLVSVDLQNKTNQILSGQEKLGDAKSASINGDFAFVYSQDKGIIRVDTKSAKSQSVVKPDEEWGVIIDINGFGSNFYLLDTTKNNIWKYVPVESGYSNKIPYFKGSVQISDAKRMLIDSSIWVAKPGGIIKKYTQGAEDNFAISGLDKAITQASAFFVSDKTENVYIVDQEHSRLVVVTKKGEYLSQYIGDKFKTVTDLVVDEKNKKIFLLDQDKIYQIELQ